MVQAASSHNSVISETTDYPAKTTKRVARNIHYTRGLHNNRGARLCLAPPCVHTSAPRLTYLHVRPVVRLLYLLIAPNRFVHITQPCGYVSFLRLGKAELHEKHGQVDVIKCLRQALQGYNRHGAQLVAVKFNVDFSSLDKASKFTVLVCPGVDYVVVLPLQERRCVDFAWKSFSQLVRFYPRLYCGFLGQLARCYGLSVVGCTQNGALGTAIQRADVRAATPPESRPKFLDQTLLFV